MISADPVGSVTVEFRDVYEAVMILDGKCTAHSVHVKVKLLEACKRRDIRIPCKKPRLVLLMLLDGKPPRISGCGKRSEAREKSKSRE
jgi:hypothetical protein